jgi:PAN domain
LADLRGPPRIVNAPVTIPNDPFGVGFSSRLATIFATGAAAAGAIAAGPPENGFDRPGGVYSNVPADDAAACAIACAQDKICMSWSFRTTDYVGCSLKAVVPARVADATAISGVADRAADFLSLVAIDPPAPVAAPAQIPPEPLRAAALTAAPTFSRLVVTTPARPVSLPQIAPLAAEEKTALVELPKSFSLAASTSAPVAYHSPSITFAAPLSNAAPILTIETPTPFRHTALVSAPKPSRSASVLASQLPASSVVATPETPPTLDAPASLRTLPAVTRIASRPFANAVASLTDARPITEIAAPAPLDRVRLTPPPAPPPAPLAQPLSRTGLGAQITLAIPSPSAKPPSPSAVPAAYAQQEAAAFENASVSGADEEELLGAP